MAALLLRGHTQGEPSAASRSPVLPPRWTPAPTVTPIPEMDSPSQDQTLQTTRTLCSPGTMQLHTTQGGSPAATAPHSRVQRETGGCRLQTLVPTTLQPEPTEVDAAKEPERALSHFLCPPYPREELRSFTGHTLLLQEEP